MKDYLEDSNRSSNADIYTVSDPSRRIVLRGGLAVALGGLFAPLAPARAQSSAPSGSRLGFRAVAASTADAVSVPEGYIATPMFKWGEPVGIEGHMPEFRIDAGNSAAEQAAQIGMHHDGMHYFPLQGSRRGLLVMNHEYTDDGLLHTHGMKTWAPEQVQKSLAAHGVSVIEIELREDAWHIVRPSRYARRITGMTPMRLSGPAAGHAMMRTSADPDGTRVLGTLNNCAHGFTPWGTYLTCEENFLYYFNGVEDPDEHQRRWGMRPDGLGYRWHEHEERFDVARHPNESNRFGWVVEIDPFDPDMTPVKRTALGRAAREGATVAQTSDGRVVVYMGEDARFEHIYKFVSRDNVQPGGFAANRDLLDHGTLYVARFDADQRGEWLELTAGNNSLTAQHGFPSQADVLIKLRQAADLIGGTKMDRPEWIAVDHSAREVYCTLTNNTGRGSEEYPVDAANPRARNTMGHIIKWREAEDFDSKHFEWEHFVLAGDPMNEREEARGNVDGDAFGSPDGLYLDSRGVLWIQTDMFAAGMYRGENERLGNNAMLAADVVSGEIRRFLVAPPHAEVTGAVMAPDLRTMFVNIQHPGESTEGRNDPEDPSRFSTWPDGGRPRSATVVVRRRDGGIIGT
jgi:uncharacterized protein